MAKIMCAEEAISTFVKDGDTVAFGGFVGSAHPEELSATIQQMYLEKGFPSNLTLIYAAGQGDGKERGLNHLGEEGLVRKVIGGHWNLSPKLQKLALENKMAAYNLPQGVIIHLYRDIAAGKPGVITHVGLGTFVDPRLEGGKLNQKAAEVSYLSPLLLYLTLKPLPNCNSHYKNCTRQADTLFVRFACL